MVRFLSPKDILQPSYANICTDEELQQTANRFGTQKGISSDEFFGRETFNPAAQAEAKSRLSNFEGATAISSNAYFGRPEDDLPSVDEYGGYGDLEGAARDFVRRFGITAGDDLEQLTQVLGDGATKLQGKLQSTYFDAHDSSSR
jgi:ADP-ribosylation factor GTPase-activating protein 2/3